MRAARPYTAGAIVVTGSPGNFSFVACGPERIAFEVVDGETYSIVVFDDQSDGNPANGGSLSFSLVEGTLPSVELVIYPVGQFTSDGRAILTGTFTCSGAPVNDIVSFLEQPVGRFAIQGDYANVDLPCDGTPLTLEFEIIPRSGKFKGGRANVTYSFGGCGEVFCDGGEVHDTIRLRK